jgi:Uma2 family endonuclease
MTVPAEKPRHTIDEYLRIERDSIDKHEFHDGEILAMSGGSVVHSLISSNVIQTLGNRLKGRKCRAYDSNLRVRTGELSRYVYPDATVICGPPQIDPADSKGETVMNPRVIVEVLSPSTEGYDRGDKFEGYRQTPSLEEYVLVSQNIPRIEVFSRRPDGSWLFTPDAGLEAAAKLLCLELELPLADVYADVEFPSLAASTPA